MTVRWKYMEKDAYKQAWVNYCLSRSKSLDEARKGLSEYRGVMAGWEIMFESEEDLQFFLLKWA